MSYNPCIVFPVIRFDILMKYQHQVQQQIHSTADTHDLRCTVCHGVFSSRGDLDSHMLTHTQQKLTSTDNLKHKVSGRELEAFFTVTCFERLPHVEGLNCGCVCV